MLEVEALEHQGTMAARPCEAEEAQNSKMRKSPLRDLGTKSLTGSAWAILCKACHARTPRGHRGGVFGSHDESSRSAAH